VIQLQVLSVQSTNISLSWIISTSSSNNSSYNYSVHIGQGCIGDGLDSIYTGPEENYTIQSLMPDTIYSIQVTVEGSTGDGQSDIIAVRTEEQGLKST